METATVAWTAGVAGLGLLYWFVMVMGAAEVKGKRGVDLKMGSITDENIRKFVMVMVAAEVKGKRGVDLKMGSITDENVKDKYTQYWSFFRSPKETAATAASAEKVPVFVDTFYNLVTEIYEWGWGQSFHFSPALPGKSDRDVTRVYEERDADLLHAKPGHRLLDVGGPMHVINQSRVTSNKMRFTKQTRALGFLLLLLFPQVVVATRHLSSGGIAAMSPSASGQVTDSNEHHRHRLSGGPIAGICIGGAVALGGIAVLTWYCLRRRRRSGAAAPSPSSTKPAHAAAGSSPSTTEPAASSMTTDITSSSSTTQPAPGASTSTAKLVAASRFCGGFATLFKAGADLSKMEEGGGLRKSRWTRRRGFFFF